MCPIELHPTVFNLARAWPEFWISRTGHLDTVEAVGEITGNLSAAGVKSPVGFPVSSFLLSCFMFFRPFLMSPFQNPHGNKYGRHIECEPLAGHITRVLSQAGWIPRIFHPHNSQITSVRYSLNPHVPGEKCHVSWWNPRFLHPFCWIHRRPAEVISPMTRAIQAFMASTLPSS